MTGGNRQKAIGGNMKKIIMLAALVGLFVSGYEAQALEAKSLDKSPVVHEGVVSPCMPIFGLNTISIMKNFTMKSFKY